MSTALASAQVPLPAPNPWRAAAPAPATTPAHAAHAAFTTETAPSSIRNLLGATNPAQASVPASRPAAFAPAGAAPAMPSLIDNLRPTPSAPISADAPKIKEALARLDK